jgi:hypothetical protein
MSNRGGARPNSGRKKIEGGKRRFLTIPPDIEEWAQIHGTAWIWEQVRYAVTIQQQNEYEQEETGSDTTL